MNEIFKKFTLSKKELDYESEKQYIRDSLLI